MKLGQVGKACVILQISLCTAAGQRTVQYPDQGRLWDLSLRQRFWYTDQGSKLLPYDWFLKLRKADGTGRFAQGLDRYGFIPSDFSGNAGVALQLNPDQLPIGFATHVENDRKWVGLTCAACHASRIDYKGQTLIVDGAPGMLNFDAFFGDLVDAINAPVNSAAALGADSGELTRLRTALNSRRAMNATPVPAGFARVDAFGQIFNQIVVGALGNDPARAGVPNAPASYPFLWDIAQHEFLQWNGSAPNLGVGGTGSKLRNVGEVLGVFGDVTVPTPVTEMKYSSTVNLTNLVSIEKWLETLLPPAWPASFPAPDPDNVQAGQAIYQSECVSCHQLLTRGALKYPTPIHMTPVDEVQTDRQLVDNFRLRTAETHQLEGSAIHVDVKHPLEKFGPVAPVRLLAAHVTIGTLENLQQESAIQKAEDAARSLKDGTPDIAAYKARPLDGIWATAPYLHNGSVPNLEELLKPARDRVREFCVGSFEYDPRRVGYVTACGDHTSLLDTTRIGNSNAGHEYGVGLSEKQKAQLIDYLKTL